MENGINEGVEMLCGGIVRQALEDLFERPRTKAPDRIIAKEKWVKEKNAEIEDNRVDALNWLGNSDMMAQLELEPSYIVAQFYEANKGRCLSLYKTMQQFYKAGYDKGKSESDTELTTTREELYKTLAHLNEAKQTIADLKRSVVALTRENKHLIKNQTKVKDGLEQAIHNKEYKKITRLLDALEAQNDFKNNV